MIKFIPFTGTIVSIENFSGQNPAQDGCYKLISVESSDESIVNFVVSPSTYFVDHVMVKVGDNITAFYDANAPTPLIFPPRLRPLVIAKNDGKQNVKVDLFDSDLLSSDKELKLNIAPNTLVVLENGQLFTGNLANRYLIVVYGPTTRSIPAQTTPYEVIVMCTSEI